MPKDTVLAVWTFFDPAIVAPSSEWVQGLQLATGKKRVAGDPTPAATGTKGLKGKVRLNAQRVQDLRNHLNGKGLLYDSTGRDLMPIIEQRHGDMVHVPAGYMHQVENLQPCVKIAFDKYVCANLARYALSWWYVTCQIWRSSDYMGAAVLVKEAINKLVNKW